ncbi:T9SS type A sorting domain-containing protein [Formosa sediminum]|uniref:T9SS type A sorting domain-containing protein n=1 Tax=Formosa sediminum TaxID=2594004 RepID=A0A516GM98_9FLAO|nr:T9SS type A sorting domain-containing protein [Formosa sediminum]QDO92654.1 T9SS type A sorting domain-containing protein [Formosa sediminum]
MKQTLLSLCLFASLSAFAQQPVLYNGQFDQIPKAPGSSDCSCSHWINKDLGDQGETSSTGVEDPNKALKFDNFESDVIYQEVAVLPNTEYKLTYSARVDDDVDPDVTPTTLEIRILKGSGYREDYDIIYYSDATIKPTSEFGYSDITEVEDETNNIVVTTLTHPGEDSYTEYELTFNTGDETSIAIFARGTGRPDTAPDDASDSRPWLWSSGEDEAFLDYITLTNNTLSVKDNALASGLKVYPNPVTSELNIKSENNIAIQSVQLYNVLGAEVLSVNKLINNTINVSNLTSGIYILKVNAENNASTSKRIIIE